MYAYVSLWSADLLDVGRAVDLVADIADGFHLDVFDGHNVDELPFGPDFVVALRAAIAALRAGRVRTDGVISHRFDLADYGRALATLIDDPTAHKVMITL